MPAKLTQSEKNARGTAQKCRFLQPRSRRAIRRDMTELRRLISDMEYNLQIARKTIKTDGVLLEVFVTNSSGQFGRSRKLNPAFKIQAQAISALKSLTRQLDFLREEREAAEAKERRAEDVSEFSI